MAIRYGTAAGDILNGTSGNDLLYGRAGNDFLYGYAGDDRLDGGTGVDVLRGGSGNDTYVVNNLFDRVLEASGEGYDTVRSVGNYYLEAGSSVEVLTTTNTLGTSAVSLGGNDLANTIRGNAGHNFLWGGDGNDVLSGMDGDDVLIGGSGKDRLVGGEGQDWFVFSDSLNRDVISDFQHGTDHIDLGYIIDGTDFDFIGAAAFSHHAGEGRFANEVFQLDSDGDGVADFSIRLLDADQIDASDFGFLAIGYWDY